MKRHILCLGDSNTYGFSPDPVQAPGMRFSEQERWPCLLQDGLGPEYLVIEEGLPGRTTVFEDPVEEGMSALPYLYPCLMSHGPLALLVVMLGTNDTKQRLGASALAIGKGLARLIRKARATPCWEREPNLLVIAPLAMEEGVTRSGAAQEMGEGCVEKSRALPQQFRAVAGELGCHFLDANKLGLRYNTIDYMHLTRESHALLAKALTRRIASLL